MCQAVANISEGGYLLGHGIQGSFDLRQRKADLEQLCLIQEPIPGGTGDGIPDSSKLMGAIRAQPSPSGLQSLLGFLGCWTPQWPHSLST